MASGRNNLRFVAGHCLTFQRGLWSVLHAALYQCLFACFFAVLLKVLQSWSFSSTSLSVSSFVWSWTSRRCQTSASGRALEDVGRVLFPKSPQASYLRYINLHVWTFASLFFFSPLTKDMFLIVCWRQNILQIFFGSTGWNLGELPVLQLCKRRPYRGAVQHAVLIWQRSLSSVFPEVPCTCIRNIPWTPLKNSTVLHYAEVVMVAPATLGSIHSRAAWGWTLLMVARGGLFQGEPLPFKGANGISGQSPADWRLLVSNRITVTMQLLQHGHFCAVEAGAETCNETHTGLLSSRLSAVISK